MILRRRSTPRPGWWCVLSVAAALTTVRAHEEWNNLHITYAARASFTYPFDGRSPKVAAALLNHYPTAGAPTVFTFSVNGARVDDPSLKTFPDGGAIVADPDNFGMASALTAGIYDGRAGPPPAVGETKEYTFQFVFALAPGVSAPPPSGAISNPDPGSNDDPPGTTTARVRFTNLGDNPAMSGTFPCIGTLRLAAPAGGPAPANVRIEVATPYSNWFPITTSGGGTTYSFGQFIPARDDWHLRLSADGFETRVIALGFTNEPHPPLDLTLSPAAPLDLDYRRVAAIATPTGFWRGAVSESEGTFVVFPGQETWKATTTDADARALRTASRIYKYKFDGTRLWEHAPGWETWGGDMTTDGRFVAYVLNPTVRPFHAPTENKLVLLDGLTGTPIWTKAAAPTDAAVGRKLDSLELVFSPDARWIAVGTVGTGTVTLVDRATGNFAWTAPRTATPSFGQVRRLRFSPDSQFLYCASGDSTVRKLRVTDGGVLWKTFAGGWPNVNGLDLTPDGSWLVAGTKSLDATLIRTSDGFMQWQREAQFPDATMSPAGGYVVTGGGQVYRTLDGSLAGMTKVAATARFTPDARYVLQIGREFRLHDLGGKLLKTFEPPGLGTTASDSIQWTHLTRDGRTAIVLARDLANPSDIGIVLFERRAAATSTAGPIIVAQPLAQTAATGSTVTLAISAGGAGPLSYRWRKDGADLPEASATAGPALVIPNISAASAGTYSCVVTNSAGSTVSAPASLVVAAADAANPGRLTNLAVRATVGSTPLIVGFSIGGANTNGTKPLLVRGAGPSLTALGVPGVLADPRLAIFQGATQVAENRDWAGDGQVAALATQLGAFPFSGAASRDAALTAIAVGGSYTAQVTSSDATTGTALAEIYDGSATFGPTTPRLVNLSARTDVDGTNVLIAGFVITGSTAKTVLVRGIGPALAGFGVGNAVGDTQVALFRDGAPVVLNDNWYEAPNAVAIATTAQNVGAFALPPTSRDAALLLSLPPGNYTAQVSGVGPSASGSALVEVYDVP